MVLLFLFTTCIVLKESIKITQKECDLPVYAILSDDTKRVVRLCYPKEISIKNNSLTKKSFIKISYHYNSITNSIGDFLYLYKKENNILKEISNNNKKVILPKKSQKFIFYTVHYINKNIFFLDQFKSYQKKMIAENKDTLHIGTVAAFKRKHNEVFEKLTKGDSISVQFLRGSKLGGRITVPVVW